MRRVVFPGMCGHGCPTVDRPPCPWPIQDRFPPTAANTDDDTSPLFVGQNGYATRECPRPLTLTPVTVAILNTSCIFPLPAADANVIIASSRGESPCGS